MFGSTIQPQAPVSFYNQAYGPIGAPQQQKLAASLDAMAYLPGTTGAGAGGFAGLPGYGGQINPTANPNLSGAWSNWQPWNAGNEFVASWLGGGAGTSGQPASSMPAQPGAIAPWAQNARGNVLQYGGVGGFPTSSLASTVQYGAPSQVGQFMSGIAQGYGTPANYLSPFLNARPYQAMWG